MAIVYGYPPPVAQPAAHIPEDTPLVLRPRLSRFLGVYGLLYLGFPILIGLCFLGILLFWLPPAERDEIPSILLFASTVPLIGGALQLAMMVGLGMSGGPYLAASADGVWVRARKWPARSVFLPWAAVARIYRRRWMWDQVVCVQAHDRRAGHEAGAMARLDTRVQRTLFGAGLTASTFFCGRNADEVFHELRMLSAGRVPIG
jgi:hypothetical protein